MPIDDPDLTDELLGRTCDAEILVVPTEFATEVGHRRLQRCPCRDPRS